MIGKPIDGVTSPPVPDPARGAASVETVRTIAQVTPDIPPTPAPIPAQPVQPDPYSQPKEPRR